MYLFQRSFIPTNKFMTELLRARERKLSLRVMLFFKIFFCIGIILIFLGYVIRFINKKQNLCSITSFFS